MQVKYSKIRKEEKYHDKKFSRFFDTARNLAVFFYENGELDIKNENLY